MENPTSHNFSFVNEVGCNKRRFQLKTQHIGNYENNYKNVMLRDL